MEYRDFAISQRSFVLNHRRIVHGSRTISMSFYDRKGESCVLSSAKIMCLCFSCVALLDQKVVDFLSKSPSFPVLPPCFYFAPPTFHFLLPCFHFIPPNFLDKPPGFLALLPHFHIVPPYLTGSAMHFSNLLILSAPPLRV